MATLTKKEQKWLDSLEELLSNPPSDRIGFFTIGDKNLTAYDRRREGEIHAIMDKSNRDFCHVVDELEAGFGWVDTAMKIHSTAG